MTIVGVKAQTLTGNLSYGCSLKIPKMLLIKLATGTAKIKPKNPPTCAPINKETKTSTGFKPVNSPKRRGAITLSTICSTTKATAKTLNPNQILFNAIKKLTKLMLKAAPKGNSAIKPTTSPNNKPKGTRTIKKAIVIETPITEATVNCPTK